MIFDEEFAEVVSFISELLSGGLVECVARIGRTTSFYPSKECIDRFVPLDQLVSLVDRLSGEHVVIRIMNETGEYAVIAFKHHGEVFVIVPRKNMDREVISLIRSFFYKRQSRREQRNYINPKIRTASKC